MSDAGMRWRFDPAAATGDNRWTYHLPSRFGAPVRPCRMFDDAYPRKKIGILSLPWQPFCQARPTGIPKRRAPGFRRRPGEPPARTAELRSVCQTSLSQVQSVVSACACQSELMLAYKATKPNNSAIPCQGVAKFFCQIVLVRRRMRRAISDTKGLDGVRFLKGRSTSSGISHYPDEGTGISS